MKLFTESFLRLPEGEELPLFPETISTTLWWVAKNTTKKMPAAAMKKVAVAASPYCELNGWAA